MFSRFIIFGAIVLVWLCPFTVLVQHPSGGDDEGDPRWISRWVDYKLESE